MSCSKTGFRKQESHCSNARPRPRPPSTLFYKICFGSLVILQQFCKNMPCREPSNVIHLLQPPHQCWCAHLDLDLGIDEHMCCIGCRGRIVILDLNLYNAEKCLCNPRPGRTPAHFCTVCKNVQCLPNGTAPLRTQIAIRRALAWAEREELGLNFQRLRW